MFPFLLCMKLKWNFTIILKSDPVRHRICIYVRLFQLGTFLNVMVLYLPKYDNTFWAFIICSSDSSTVSLCLIQICWNTINRMKANWIVHVFRGNCLLKQVTEGRIEGMGRRGSGRKKLLDDVKETRRYWKSKEEALDRTVWRTCLGRGCGPVVRQTAEWMIEWLNENKHNIVF